jgi:hypothetical protein
MKPALLALALLVAPVIVQAEPAIKLDPAAQKRIGVVVAPLAAAYRSGAATGFARVLDVSPLATLDADLATAAAAAAASSAEAARTQALAAEDATVSRKVAEAARAQARADAIKLALLRRRVALEWGPAFAADARRARVIADVAAGRAALVRVDAAAGLGGVRSMRLDLGPQGSAPATVLGVARIADPRLQSAGLIGLVSGPKAALLSVGMTATAILDRADGAAGVVLPRAGLVRTGGLTFAYVRKGPDQFERRPVVGGAPQADGLFAPTGFRPGELVVVEGAAALLAAETAPPKSDAKKGED